MPDTADLSQIKAKYEDGTLHLDIPKVPVSLPPPQPFCFATTYVRRSDMIDLRSILWNDTCILVNTSAHLAPLLLSSVVYML